LFENYTERGKDAVLLSIEEASRLGHDCVGTEHLVLGLIRVEAGMARHILVGKGLDLESLRAEVRRIVGTGEGSPEVQPPLSNTQQGKCRSKDASQPRRPDIHRNESDSGNAPQERKWTTQVS
jgi:ATP-dependent Clp protease ATP-binding subunit ClpA